ncbi:MAG TPA: aminotransferase class III-fold pyridoxal phosphate-dependent enzyme [Rhodospirillales bacterium]|jgi:taurine--2-oxoglutarate transaminase|nr:aminotransferase class III-fold pyridoxal phosphate-dependent enzyme [Rhodospirillales bacterium]
MDAVAAENREFVLFPWSKQNTLAPLTIARAEGPYFWDADGGRYVDFSNQLVCVNAGHQHPKIVAAVKAQAATLCYAAPSFATEVRGRLARLIADVTPGDLAKTYFSSGGSEAIEYAIKIAKMVTGRPKIIARYRSYHGASSGAVSLTGDARRPHNEPGMVGALHAFSPLCYHCTFGHKPDSCARECVGAIEELIEFENPDFIAAIIVEPITGPANNLIVPVDDYLPRLRALCDKYGILLIADEIMSGWGRTGRWFGVDHYGVVPDILVTAKGLTNSAVPLGATVVSERIAAFMDENTLWSGSTYSGHALACAAGIAAIGVYRDEGLIENSARLGEVLLGALEALKEKHGCVGDVRGKGLFSGIELVSDRATRAPLLPDRTEAFFAASGGLGRIKKVLADNGVYVYLRPNMLGIAPALCITEDQLLDGLARIDKVLDVADSLIADSRAAATQ